MATYVLDLVDRAGRNYMVPIHHFPFTIGRERENDLPITGSSISRRHASLEKLGNDIVIIDHDSRNHVFVNGQQVAKKIVRMGDVLRIGSVEMSINPAPNLRIRSATGDCETLYYPQRDSWNPLETLNLSPDSEASPSSTTRKRDWRKLFRFSLKAGPSELYERVLDAVEESVPFDRCYVIFFRSDSIEVLARRFGASSDGGSRGTTAEIFLSREILRRVRKTREAVLVSGEDPSISLRESFIMSGARAALCLPFVVDKHVVGVLYLDRLSDAKGFSEDDVDALGPLAGILALKLENLLLHSGGSLRRKEERKPSEPTRSRLYPSGDVVVGPFQASLCSRRGRQEGGDFSDLFSCGESSMAAVIGEVSGVGAESVAERVGVLATLRAHLLDGLGLEQTIARLDNYLGDMFRPDQLLSLFVATVDSSTGVLTCYRAGVLPALRLRHDGDVAPLERTSDALSATTVQESPRCLHHALERGDWVVAHTAGFLQAAGEGHEGAAKERLVACLGRHEGTPDSAREGLLTELGLLQEDGGPLGDFTLLLLRNGD